MNRQDKVGRHLRASRIMNTSHNLELLIGILLYATTLFRAARQLDQVSRQNSHVTKYSYFGYYRKNMIYKLCLCSQ